MHAGSKHTTGQYLAETNSSGAGTTAYTGIVSFCSNLAFLKSCFFRKTATESGEETFRSTQPWKVLFSDSTKSVYTQDNHLSLHVRPRTRQETSIFVFSEIGESADFQKISNKNWIRELQDDPGLETAFE